MGIKAESRGGVLSPPPWTTRDLGSTILQPSADQWKKMGAYGLDWWRLLLVLGPVNRPVGWRDVADLLGYDKRRAQRVMAAGRKGQVVVDLKGAATFIGEVILETGSSTVWRDRKVARDREKRRAWSRPEVTHLVRQVPAMLAWAEEEGSSPEVLATIESLADRTAAEQFLPPRQGRRLDEVREEEPEWGWDDIEAAFLSPAVPEPVPVSPVLTALAARAWVPA